MLLKVNIASGNRNHIGLYRETTLKDFDDMIEAVNCAATGKPLSLLHAQILSGVGSIIEGLKDDFKRNHMLQR